ncbi:type II secretion system major pseudopilin GspG (plasmid) [Tistrella mobilis]
MTPPTIPVAQRRHLLLTDDRGMTLLEILVVMSILGLLATLGSLQLMGYLGRAKGETAGLQMGEIATALDMFYIDVGRLPTDEEGLSALRRLPEGSPGPRGWNGPYLRKDTILSDPWGRAYLYQAPSGRGSYELKSLGADGRPGGEGEDADIVFDAG